MSTTSLPSTCPRVLKVGPGPRDTNGTVITDINNPKTTIGISATSNVATRRFMPALYGNRRSAPRR
ncbi:Uncharacterised protein [Mycobacteroides abscessus subsp. abscessus]|nr:Uncharacterised protein [Mycobacteroides abscessus subsp. abscessus]